MRGRDPPNAAGLWDGRHTQLFPSLPAWVPLLALAQEMNYLHRPFACLLHVAFMHRYNTHRF